VGEYQCKKGGNPIFFARNDRGGRGRKEKTFLPILQKKEGKYNETKFWGLQRLRGTGKEKSGKKKEKNKIKTFFHNTGVYLRVVINFYN